jgi:hypothetical protein
VVIERDMFRIKAIVPIAYDTSPMAAHSGRANAPEPRRAVRGKVFTGWRAAHPVGGQGHARAGSIALLHVASSSKGRLPRSPRITVSVLEDPFDPSPAHVPAATGHLVVQDRGGAGQLHRHRSPIFEDRPAVRAVANDATTLYPRAAVEIAGE